MSLVSPKCLSGTAVMKMALFIVKPTTVDISIANAVAKHPSPVLEKLASVLTFAADERFLLALAVAGWIYSREKTSDIRRTWDHGLLVVTAASVLPHLLKRIFDQTRPDRLTIRGHLHGIPLSGKRQDAFPSGHALHMGALAALASSFPPKQRRAIWSATVGLSLSRIVLLAHWTSDVLVGFTLGTVLERVLRHFTGYRNQPDNPAEKRFRRTPRRRDRA